MRIAAAMSLAGMAAVLTPTLAQAADWWIVSSEAPQLTVLADAETLHCDAGQCSVWERTVYKQVAPDSPSALKDLVRYDCANRTTATASELVYDSGDLVQKEVAATELSWVPVGRDTVADAALTFACNFDALHRATPAAKVLSADGWSFSEVASASAPLPARAAAVPARPRPPVAGAAAAPVARPRPAAATAAAARPTAIPARPAPAASPGARTGAPSSNFTAQVGAGASTAAAQQLLDTLTSSKPTLFRGVAGRVEAAVVSGKPVYRALVQGFPSIQDAARFCATLHQTGQACFVRPSQGR